MSSPPKIIFPANPYQRSPIKKYDNLAGRARELKAIRYYLTLTASGQSPHLALIGSRGVGKTSLLNGAESLAKELKLLAVRLDMNEQKANSPWLFWRDLYQTLALAMVRVGCWGGLQGPIYAELLRMIHSRQPGNLEKAVMQIPYVFSCHHGSSEEFDCPDALVIADFRTCLAELQSKGLLGIVLLVDEADCLGKNVPLLQMFRNIFQVVDHCSLLLAGTEAVFPALSEVFSPIPRQFHRIDIKPFARWSDTLELVLRPLPEDVFKAIAPNSDIIEQLHELCGGAPDEIQLYCHHMYRSVEDGSSKKMALTPKVFREVLHEYRSHSSSNVDEVLNAIERLPDSLLFEAHWLSRRSLSLEENIKVSLLLRELHRDALLSDADRAAAISEMEESYRTLFNIGIIESENYVTLAGAPLTAGFWKSFVEVERGKRWTWVDTSFAENLSDPIMGAIGMSSDAMIVQRISSHSSEAILALHSLRDGKVPSDFDDGMSEMIMSAIIAFNLSAKHAVDATFRVQSPAGSQVFGARYLEDPAKNLTREKFQLWIDSHTELLATHNISVNSVDFTRWELPTSFELHRLGRISGHKIPQIFGPTQFDEAFKKFGAADVAGCAQDFATMLDDKPESRISNNLAFCLLILGKPTDALPHATKATLEDYEPLYEFNKGMAQYLTGEKEAGIQSLLNALGQFETKRSIFDPKGASHVLLLELETGTVTVHEELPIDAAILFNLKRMGGMTRESVVDKLLSFYADAGPSWLHKFDPESA